MIKINFKLILLLAVLNSSIHGSYPEEIDLDQRCLAYGAGSVTPSLTQKELEKSLGYPIVIEDHIQISLHDVLKETVNFVWQSLALMDPAVLKAQFPILNSKLGNILIPVINTPKCGISYDEWGSRLRKKFSTAYGLPILENFCIQAGLSVLLGNEFKYAVFTAALRMCCPLGAYVFEDEIAKIFQLAPEYIQWLVGEPDDEETFILEEQESYMGSTFFTKVGYGWHKFIPSVKRGMNQLKSAINWENTKNFTFQKGKRVINYLGIPICYENNIFL